jgi:hypothetical protein
MASVYLDVGTEASCSYLVIVVYIYLKLYGAYPQVLCVNIYIYMHMYGAPHQVLSLS